MPSGVATHFLQILGNDGRAARNRILVGAILGVAFAALAFVLGDWLGVAVHAGAYVVGVVGGLLVARSVSRRYEASIRGTWTQWMRFAVAADGIAEIHRKVRGRSNRNGPFVYAAVLFLLWGMEATLLLLAFLPDGRTDAAVALPAIGLNGALAGGILGYSLLMSRWHRAFRASVTEMVDSGEIGVWGVV